MDESPQLIDIALRERMATVETEIRSIKDTAEAHVQMNRIDHAAIHSALNKSDERLQTQIAELGRELGAQLKTLQLYQVEHISSLQLITKDTLADFLTTRNDVEKLKRESQLTKGVAKGIGVIGILIGGTLGALEAGFNIFNKAP